MFEIAVPESQARTLTTVITYRMARYIFLRIKALPQRHPQTLFSVVGDTGSTHALYLETIVEETSEDLRSERSCAATWLSDSDADSVLQVKGPQGSECDSESEREWACPAKRRRRERPTSPASSGSLSRTSSLAQFESLERSCAAPASPSLSPDSLDSPPTSPPRTRRAPPLRQHLSAENLSEDSGYSERSRRPAPAHAPASHQTEIARRRPPAASTPCLAAVVRVPSPERRPRTAARARSLPADLDICAEPRRLALAQHCARFQQAFQVCDSLTVSVADLTALDYRGGPRRPRHPPPPPPRNPPPPPPAPPRAHPPVFTPPPPLSTAREPSADSDSTTESERAFAREMETTARRLDEDARRALAEGGDFRRELSVLTARRLHDASWGVWDDVLDELRKRMAPPSPTPSLERTPSPDPVREPIFSSTPLRSGDARVRSTPELRARGSSQRSTPEELRASLQHVAGPLPGEAPPVRSVSTGSKGVTFSPVVAEVSWRETTPSTNAESESARSSSSTSDDAADAEVVEVGGGENEPARARPTERAVVMQDAGARAPRSRIAGFLSRFANFRFSGRKEKKSRGASANGRVTSGSGGGGGSGAPFATDGSQSPAATDGPQYVRIPLKDEGVSRAETSPTAGGGAGPVAHKPPRPPPVPQPTAARLPAPRPAPAPAAGLLETDVDTARTVLHARSLLALAPPDQAAPRPHKSMEFLLDKDSAQAVQWASMCWRAAPASRRPCLQTERSIGGRRPRDPRLSQHQMHRPGWRPSDAPRRVVHLAGRPRPRPSFIPLSSECQQPKGPCDVMLVLESVVSGCVKSLPNTVWPKSKCQHKHARSGAVRTHPMGELGRYEVVILLL
ncbi:hypothetical protein EVAR_94206_1 [Eumeta japonica]|uniref:Uncharacterized protein n=1 Tax=Eumeta variegata TaxID=151549 RepID=A0A4C1UPA3_EUMVA|nr:hypothetical protein EVAR_94206_1 [Eumeta japonica]